MDWYKVYTLVKKNYENNNDILGLEYNTADKNELRNNLRIFISDLRRKYKCNQLNEDDIKLLERINEILNKDNNKSFNIKK